MGIDASRAIPITAIGILALLAACTTTEQRPGAERDGNRPPHAAAQVTSFDSNDFWSAARRGDAVAVIAAGVPTAVEPIVVSRTQGILSRAGFTIVERHVQQSLLEEIRRQLEPLYEDSTALRLGSWLQSNLLAMVSVQLLRTSPAITPHDSRNFYHSPQTEIAVYDLSSRKKILSIAVQEFHTAGQMTESAAVSALLEYVEHEFARLHGSTHDTERARAVQ